MATIKPHYTAIIALLLFSIRLLACNNGFGFEYMFNVVLHNYVTLPVYPCQDYDYDLPRAALAAALATLGSTTDARKATVDITGLPC